LLKAEPFCSKVEIIYSNFQSGVRKIDGIQFIILKDGFSQGNLQVAMTTQNIWQCLEQVTDPEVPVLSILDLGIVRNVEISGSDDNTSVKVVITPTYSGCPAMDVIAIGIRMALAGKGIKHIHIEALLSPAWTTDWMTEEGKRKLKEYGIAPPNRKAFQALGLFEEDAVSCPRCGSDETQQVSQFGPTSCKALYKCLSCKEPFEHFKCH
jgi:ring-1,2-phenylacetyl-CoA epoxidase subunit PaaD